MSEENLDTLLRYDLVVDPGCRGHEVNTHVELIWSNGLCILFAMPGCVSLGFCRVLHPTEPHWVLLVEIPVRLYPYQWRGLADSFIHRLGATSPRSKNSVQMLLLYHVLGNMQYSDVASASDLGTYPGVSFVFFQGIKQ